MGAQQLTICCFMNENVKNASKNKMFPLQTWILGGLNPRPSVCKTDALPLRQGPICAQQPSTSHYTNPSNTPHHLLKFLSNFEHPCTYLCRYTRTDQSSTRHCVFMFSHSLMLITSFTGTAKHIASHRRLTSPIVNNIRFIL